ncbi:hypothetical protein SAMN03097699_0586 [Flavobacteriaceae bacterium MAR_2010_188]|nr:hypothetical protein SAMN03097699_0586 [Flavobacteriaceae bacterium MAR_2010_188]
MKKELGRSPKLLMMYWIPLWAHERERVILFETETEVEFEFEFEIVIERIRAKPEAFNDVLDSPLGSRAKASNPF